MIPVHLKKPGDQNVPDSTYYVIARNGLFLRKKQWWVEATVPVEQIAVLDDEQPTVKLLMPKLSGEILAKALKTSWEIYQKYASEVCFLLHYRKGTGYQLSVPSQTVNGSRVKAYDAMQRLPDHLCVGTLHSHGKFMAFHSKTDHFDEEFWDGVHITIGSMPSYPEFSLSAETVVNGFRFPIDLSWFEGLDLTYADGPFLVDCPSVDSWEVPSDWLAAVSKT